MQVEVRVNDVDAEHERLRQLGVEVSDLADRRLDRLTAAQPIIAAS